VAAAAGALTWIIIEGWHQGKATALGLISGVLAGLVAVTPAAGVVQPFGAMMLGIFASLLCYGGILIKNRMGYDDSLDAFGIHGVGGILGAILLTFFIRDSWMQDAAAAAGGSWGVFQQLGIQILAVAIALIYAGAGTLVLLWLINKIVKFRATPEEEMQGLDSAYHGESGYGMLNPN
jgi:Amt family ammonium transporter